ncbi:MAG: neutral/alkaline non-lysosomal ceramidase N-terminal domain-containing protein [Paenibacillaceae bacterium]|nr:neutral/alkaline non-lysosomal ceramidase N-terminal domain-containing protein [Paenibacillaceae bacterium]
MNRQTAYEEAQRKEGEKPMSLQAGVARAVITPPLTLPHAGWGAQTHIVPRGVEADLWSTVLVLANDGSVCVIVDLDVCSLSPAQSDELRRRIAAALAIGREEVRVSVTHTHAGPYLWTDYYEDKKHIRLSYLEHLMESTVGAALQARRQAVPATVGAGYGESDLAVNRRQRLADGRIVCGVQGDGYTDPTVAVVRFDDAEGNPLASIVHYAMHPTILGPPNQLVSPDYPGAVKRTVEANVGGMCLFLQGAAGDVGPGAVGYTDDPRRMRRVGHMLGCAAALALHRVTTWRTETRFDRIVESGCSLGYWSETKTAPNDETLRTLSATIRLDVKPAPEPAGARQAAEAAKERLRELQTAGGEPEALKEATYRLKRLMMAADYAELYYGVDSKEIEAHLIAVGDIALIGLPLEPFSRIGAAVRERSPFGCTLFSGYTNGWEGYLPTTDAYSDGGYEVDTTPFAAGTEERLIEQVVGLLRQLKRAVAGPGPSAAGRL